MHVTCHMSSSLRRTSYCTCHMSHVKKCEGNQSMAMLAWGPIGIKKNATEYLRKNWPKSLCNKDRFIKERILCKNRTMLILVVEASDILFYTIFCYLDDIYQSSGREVQNYFNVFEIFHFYLHWVHIEQF